MMSKVHKCCYIILSLLLITTSGIASDPTKIPGKPELPGKSNVPALNIENIQSNSQSENSQPLNTNRIIEQVVKKGINKEPAHYNPALNKVVMTLDGGGGKGYIEALMLLALEQKASKLIGQYTKIGEMIYMFGGTSTGAITSLALTVPSDEDLKKPKYGATDVVNLYENDCEKIFEQSWYQWLTSGNGLLSEKYSNVELNKLLYAKLGDAKMKDSVTNIFVTAYELKDCDKGSQAVLFTNYALGDQPVLDIKRTDAAGASSAAPTYFPPKTFEIENPETGKPESRTFIDGGVTGMNDPTTCAFSQSIALCKQQENQADIPEHEKTKLSDFLFISLGAGECPMFYNRNSFDNRSLASTIRPIVNISLDAPKGSNITILRDITSQMELNNYFRLSPGIDKPINLDDMRKSTLNYMRTKTLTYIDENSKTFDMLARRMAFGVLIKNSSLNSSALTDMLVAYMDDNLIDLYFKRLQLLAALELNTEFIKNTRNICSNSTQSNVENIIEKAVIGRKLAQNTPACKALADYNASLKSSTHSPRTLLDQLLSNSLKSSDDNHSEALPINDNREKFAEQCTRTRSLTALPLSTIQTSDYENMDGHIQSDTSLIQTYHGLKNSGMKQPVDDTPPDASNLNLQSDSLKFKRSKSLKSLPLCDIKNIQNESIVKTSKLNSPRSANHVQFNVKNGRIDGLKSYVPQVTTPSTLKNDNEVQQKRFAPPALKHSNSKDINFEKVSLFGGSF